MRHDRILWWGNVRRLDFRARLDFASRNRFDALNVSPADLDDLCTAGETLPSIRRMADDAGVALTYLDPVLDWLPDWRPTGAAAAMTPFLDRRLGRALDDADALGIDRVLAVTCFPPGTRSVDDVAPHLDAFADAAVTRGITVVLEAMPMWGLTRFSDVVALRAAVDRPNVKLLFDTWHYCRGERCDALIETLEPGAIDHVQIADGTAETAPGLSLFEDCLQRRLPPGEGALPLDEILALLHAAGHLTSAGPEVFSAELDLLDADGIADRLLPGFEAALSETGLARPARDAA